MKTCFKSILILTLNLSLSLKPQSSWASTSDTVASITVVNSLGDKNLTLENLNKVAELEFVEGDLAKAQKTYQKMTDMALNEKWSDTSRELIFNSFFRMAQLEKEKESQWVSKAHHFASDLKPNVKTTPQKLSLLYSNLNAQSDLIEINADDLKNKTVNGSNTVGKLYKDKIYRLDYSDENNEVTIHFIKGSLIAGFKPTPAKKTQTLKSQLLASTLPNKTSRDLVYTQPFSQGFDVVSESNSIENSFQSTTGLQSTSFGLSSEKPKSNFKRNRWLYIGSTVLAVTLGAMLISKNNDKSNSYEPTQNQGF